MGAKPSHSAHSTPPDDHFDKFRGLRYTLGWQKDRLCLVVLRGLAWPYLTIAIVWLCVVVWDKTRGSWETALALGQLIAASATLLFMCV